jgi:hypothetical protein
MNIQQVLDNLDNTIAGKEIMLSKYKPGKTAIDWIVADFLTINIDELKKIREDVAKISLQGDSKDV